MTDAITVRERIVGAAFAAFVARGYANTSTLEIATRAKVSKRDLYATFPSKQAILLACIADRAGRMSPPAALPAPHNAQVLAATLTAFGATVLREVSDAHVIAMFRLAIAEAAHAPEVAATLSESRSANRGAIADLIAQAQAGGVLADGDPQALMEQYFALLWGDLLLGQLLAAAAAPSAVEAEARAAAATRAFLALYETPGV